MNTEVNVEMQGPAVAQVTNEEPKEKPAKKVAAPKKAAPVKKVAKKAEPAKKVVKKAEPKKVVKAEPAKANGKTKRTDDPKMVLKYIEHMVVQKFGTYTAYAEKEQVSLAYISNVMSGKKPIPDWMLKRFKLRKVVSTHWEVVQ